MKRIVSIVLIFLLFAASTCLSAFASDNSKITQSLQVKLDQMEDDEKTPAGVFLICRYNRDEISNQAIKESGAHDFNNLDEQYAYRAAYNRILKEIESAASRAFIEKMAIPEEDVIFCSAHAFVIANLTKAQINEAAQFSEVESIYEVRDLPVEAAKEYEDSLSREERFKNLIEKQFGKTFESNEYYYSELCSGDGWVLVRCGINMESPMLYSAIIGNRVILHYSCPMPFESGYAVFDEGDKSFTDAALLTKAYDDFVKAFDENVTDGRLLGDIDNDGDISIIDVTMIQRCDAEISEWSNNDVIAYLDDWNEHDQVYYSDFNRDGSRDIVDATCIQRYLVGLDYPIG